MNLLATFFLLMMIRAVVLQPVVPEDPQSPTPDGPVDANSDGGSYPWYWGPGCRCMHGGWGWGPWRHHGWHMGPRGWWGPGGMRRWGPGGWQDWGTLPSRTQDGGTASDVNNPFMPWFLQDLTPDERKRFWEEIGDSLPPPMTYERRARILEALRKVTS